jgi:hypothetical protein
VEAVSVWSLANDILLGEQDLSLSESAAVKNDAAIRVLCAVRQLAMRFGR